MDEFKTTDSTSSEETSNETDVALVVGVSLIAVGVTGMAVAVAAKLIQKHADKKAEEKWTKITHMILTEQLNSPN